MERYSMFMNRKIKNGQNVSSSQLDLQIQCNANQNTSKLFVDVNKLILKIIVRSKRPRMASTILKEEQKFLVFNFNEVLFINYSFHGLCLWCYIKNSSPNPKSFRFSPMLFSKSFIDLHFTFRSRSHFELF